MITLLLGVFGSGKSSVAQLLAKQQGVPFVEMDTLIQQTMGVKDPASVPEHAWKECQIDVCKDLSVQDNMVIAASGNIVDNDVNLLYFRAAGKNVKVIYLAASIETLAARTVSSDHENPARMKEKLNDILAMRDPLYRKFADVVIDTDTKTPQQIADELTRKIS